MGKTKQETAMIGFEIVAYAGDARTKLLNALNEAQKGNLEKAEEMVNEADTIINQAHNSQTEMLKEEAAGEEMDLGFIMVHGQDHLMTTMLLKDMMKHMIELYRRTQ
ncbi:lactose-specific PTS transporter subunit IIA [Salisediminibacterium halotolerans]|uniref:PTS system lactose-specific EIIA component n=1 Tax=Salisediminibacterium halotolerans TaxID=517425 RepID=A0A1H9U7U7_9BACI|nr:lactose-specific PTS transporter subunit IIA [Salisediminibacterium haloalkalitolerans]SES05331.1 PTS system, lactose-specific IIA component [Salisediminibacterium haloalkalitolerans]